MKSLLNLATTSDRNLLQLPVSLDLCVGQPGRLFLFGGAALAAGIKAMELVSGRPAIWATSHYLSYAQPGSVLDLDVHIAADGHSITQARAAAHIADQEVITVYAALGTRQDSYSDQWITAPIVPAPQDCPEILRPTATPGGIEQRFEIRLISGRIPDGTPLSGRGQGRPQLWVRSREGIPVDNLMLAFIADFVWFGIGEAIGRPAGGNSLDNTIRFGKIEQTDWILCDIQIEIIHSGVVHSVMHLYSESGTLMATASQSLILRYYDSDA